MKKLLMPVILLLALLPVFSAAAAKETPADITLQWLSAFEPCEDSVVALSDGSLYRGNYVEDTQTWAFEAFADATTPIEAFTVMESGEILIIPRGLNAICSSQGGKELAKIEPNGLRANVWEEGKALSILSFAATSAHFYVLLGNEYQLEQSCLLQIDRQTKQTRRETMQNLRAIKRYGENELLLYFYNPYDEQSLPALKQMNGENRKLKTLYETEALIGGIAVDEAEHALYFAEQGELKRMEGGNPPETIAYTYAVWDSTQDGTIFCASYADGLYTYLSSARTLETERVQPVNETRVLRIAGGEKDDAYERFMQSYPDVHVIVDIPALSATDIQLAVTADMDRADLFVVDIYDGYRELRDKGYIAPLQSDELSSFVQELYPVIRQSLMSGEDLMAIPSYFCLTPWAVNETLWRKILGDRPYPATYAQLIDLLEQWDAQAYPEVTPIEFGGSNAMLLKTLVRQFILQQAHEQEAIAFDTPEMFELFRRILALDREPVETDLQEDAFIAMEKLLFFSPMSEYGVYDEGENRIVPIAPPVLCEGDRQTVPVQMRVYVLNPRSKVADLALAYLQDVVDTYPAVMKASIIQGWSTPHLSERAQREWDTLTARLAELKQAVQAHPDSERIRQEMDSCEDSLAYIEQYGYDVSPESIEMYASLAAYMDIPLDSPYWGDANAVMRQLDDVLARMADGQTDEAQAVQEMNRISNMIYMEGM
ncbi:MAG: hypothetical protein Q4G52_09470 [Clostridia bacterium]|nr:hypothetical protein [Clostridia bacterium]